MSDDLQLLALAERVEKASGPDRGLDAEIAACLGWTGISPGNRGGRCGRSPQGAWKHVPRYTASLDAAMTLVPAGWRKDLFDADNFDCLCQFDHDDGTEIMLRAKTWPLALTAACLRAIANGADR